MLLATPLAPAQRAAPPKAAAPGGKWFCITVLDQKGGPPVTDSRITAMIFNKDGNSQDILVEGFTEGTGMVRLFLAYSQFGEPASPSNKHVRVLVTRVKLEGGDMGHRRTGELDAASATPLDPFVIPASAP
jgi:hypothetical protein